MTTKTLLSHLVVLSPVMILCVNSRQYEESGLFTVLVKFQQWMGQKP